MIRRGMTRAQEERMRVENRRKEYQREDNKKLVAQERMMRANVACDERVENKRFIRRMQQVRRVAITAYVLTHHQGTPYNQA